MKIRSLMMSLLAFVVVLNLSGAVAEEFSSAEGRRPRSLQEATDDADEKDVRSLFGGVSTQDLTGFGFTYRHDWGDFHGQHVLNLNWSAITRDSRIFVEIGECAAGGGKFIGAA